MKITTHPTEQGVLDRVIVRLIQEPEKLRWNELLEQEHDLHNPTRVGEPLRDVAEVDGHWLALLSWSGEAPTLASRILRRSLERLDADWREHYRHGLLLADPFVDIESSAGTGYKASNWIDLGKTKGFERSGTDDYEPHDRPKRLLLRPRQPQACEWLNSPEMPEEWKAHERDFHPGCTIAASSLALLETP